jgi:hypothetical protein
MTTEAARYFGVGPELISGCCTGRFKTAVGFKWEYDEPQPIFVRGKRVVQIDFDGNIIDTYISAREAARILGIDSSGITKCCVGKLQSSCGYVWLYQ